MVCLPSIFFLEFSHEFFPFSGRNGALKASVWRTNPSILVTTSYSCDLKAECAYFQKVTDNILSRRLDYSSISCSTYIYDAVASSTKMRTTKARHLLVS